MTSDTDRRTYTNLVREIETPLRRALIAAYGTETGVDATAEALAYGWENWERLSQMDNPAGYLFRVGRSRAINVFRRPRTMFPSVPQPELPHVEPALPDALSRLSRNQRVSVWLILGYGCTYREVACILGTSIGTVQKHVARGLDKLRSGLGVTDD